jgi:predicted permease
MVFTVVLVAVPALIGAIVYSMLLLGKFRPFRKRPETQRKLLLAVTYFVSIGLLALILTAIGMMLVVGTVWIPVLCIFDIIGIAILSRRFIIRRKRRQMRREVKEMRARLKKLDAEINSMNARLPAASEKDISE